MDRNDDLDLSQVPSSGDPVTRIHHGPVELGRGVVMAGRYEVERVLGEGGMGVVLAAREITGGRRVAIKFLQPAAAKVEEIRVRFQREAQAASSIACDHVVQVFGAGTLESGAPYIVMELLEGEDLSGVLQARGALPVSEAVDHVLEALVAIGLAHLRGLVHRDLKPANLFLTRRADGQPVVKVLDFGLSKDTADPASLRLTKTSSSAIGTPLYMAPEQIRSLKSASFASDVWAMGVILFELVANALPFDGDSLGALFAAIVADSPRRLEEVVPGTPPALADAVRRCLEKDPARRPDVAGLTSLLAPFAGPRGQIAAHRIQRDFVAAGRVPSGGGLFVDELSADRPLVGVTRASNGMPLSFATSSGDPTALLDVGGAAGRAHPSYPVSDPGRSDTGPARPSRRGPTIVAVALLVTSVLGTSAWLLTRPHGAERPSSSAPADLPRGPVGTTTAAPPEVRPSTEAIGEAPPDASANPSASAAGSAPAAPLPSAPRPGSADRQPPSGPAAAPAPSSKSLDEILKRGRR